MQERSLPLEYTIDVFNNHSAYQFYLITSVDNFDFDQVSKDFKLFRDEYPRLFRKVKESILKPLILVQNIIRQKTDLKIY
jgi:hypothetical protein